MMEAKTLRAEIRSQTGKHAAHKVRALSRIPGIIYGHGQPPVSFSVDRHDLELELQHKHRLLSLDMSGKAESFLIKEVQFDHLGMVPIHIDLARVDLHERVKVEVPVVLKGVPKGAAEGGVLEQNKSTVEIECLASAIPEEIRANVNHLGVGEQLTVAQLELPADMKVLNKPDDIIASVRVIAEEVSPAEGEVAVGATEPELIARAKPEEAEEKPE